MTSNLEMSIHRARVADMARFAEQRRFAGAVAAPLEPGTASLGLLALTTPRAESSARLRLGR